LFTHGEEFYRRLSIGRSHVPGPLLREERKLSGAAHPHALLLSTQQPTVSMDVGFIPVSGPMFELDFRAPVSNGGLTTDSRAPTLDFSHFLACEPDTESQKPAIDHT
jgi:hypothetical protein